MHSRAGNLSFLEGKSIHPLKASASIKTTKHQRNQLDLSWHSQQASQWSDLGPKKQSRYTWLWILVSYILRWWFSSYWMILDVSWMVIVTVMLSRFFYLWANCFTLFPLGRTKPGKFDKTFHRLPTTIWITIAIPHNLNVDQVTNAIW